MKKVLFVGDVHATPDELDDCRALFGLVREVAESQQVDEICLLGDSYHTFNVMRVEVLAFWRETFEMLARWRRKALVGNHDFAGEGSLLHAMIAHVDQISVVDAPLLEGGVLYLPYFSDRELFVKVSREFGGPTLVCHQTFAGSKYENGFYAEDGVNPDDLRHDNIISGHIHSPQSFGRVTYLGSPRWRTLTDANTERAIWVYTFDSAGSVVEKKSFDTGGVCRKIVYAVDTPDEPFTETLDPKHDYRIDIRGPAAYIEERKARLAGTGVKLRTFKTEQSTPVVRESEGIEKAFHKFRERFSPKWGTPLEVLGDIARQRLGF